MTINLRRRTKVVWASVMFSLVFGNSLAWWKTLVTTRDELPVFSEPTPGLVAPTTRALLDLVVGEDSLDHVNREVTARGLVCRDTSIRAAIAQLRAAKRQELAHVKAAGGDADTVSGASIVNNRSRKENNPQVRLACTQVQGRAIERHAATPGRLLAIFDSAAHPLRHVSHRRDHASIAAAVEDLHQTLRELENALGPASAGQFELPDLRDGLPDRLPPITRRWDFAGYRVQLSAVDLNRRISIEERYEVPWPMRPDAPRRSHTSKSNQS